jgi:hypothetical protein
LTRIAPTQIPTEGLDLLGTAIGVLRQRWLRAFFPKVLARLPERLGHASDCFDHVLLAHVQPRRDLLRGLFRYWRILGSPRVPTGRIVALARTG